MKSLLALLGVLLLLAVAHAASPSGPASLTFAARMGEVAFPHQRHHAAFGIDCKTCHHTGIEPAERCASCHGSLANAPTLMDAFHRQCQGCHQKRQAGPQGCRDCHPKR